MKKGIAILAVVILSACSTGNQFTSTAGYSFTVPNEWTAMNATSEGKVNFGPDATTSSGIGGIEMSANQTSVEDFLNGVQGGIGDTFTDLEDTKMGGVDATRYHITGPVAGTGVAALKDGTIYNAYVLSEQQGDTEKFDAVVDSFEF